MTPGQPAVVRLWAIFGRRVRRLAMRPVPPLLPRGTRVTWREPQSRRPQLIGTIAVFLGLVRALSVSRSMIPMISPSRPRNPSCLQTPVLPVRLFPSTRISQATRPHSICARMRPRPRWLCYVSRLRVMAISR